jgi:hypothetical protein
MLVKIHTKTKVKKGEIEIDHEKNYIQKPRIRSVKSSLYRLK